MEDLKDREQPKISEQALEENIEEFDEKLDATTSQEGSPLGKFNSPEDLLKAYNSLQAEFTRKCQKLSEIQKQFWKK